MLDIKEIVSNVGFFKKRLKNRIEDTEKISELVSLDKKRRDLISMENIALGYKNYFAKTRGQLSACISTEDSKLKELFSSSGFVNFVLNNNLDKFPDELDKDFYFFYIYGDDYEKDFVEGDNEIDPIGNAIEIAFRLKWFLVIPYNTFALGNKLDKNIFHEALKNKENDIELLNKAYNIQNNKVSISPEHYIEICKKLISSIKEIYLNSDGENYCESFIANDCRVQLEFLLKNLDKSSVTLSNFIEKIKVKLENINNNIKSIIDYLPNITLDEVQSGKNEADNEEIFHYDFREKKIELLNFEPKTHDVLASNLNLIESQKTVEMSGARFISLLGDLAQLEMALGRRFVDHAVQHGYNHISPPYIVYNKAMHGAGQLPKFDDESYRVGEDQRLIPTAEVPLISLFANSILKHENLPIRCTAWSPCFRLEAGSAGKDTKGLIRLHQFSKVEIVSITDKESSQDEFERMINIVSSLINELKLKYRIVRLCDGDTGFSSALTYDFELWMPGQNAYRETSSCSNCTSFQARRMNTRYKDKKSKKNIFAHTLNGSCLAIGRVIAAILETYQCADGTIDIPSSLIPYFGSSKIKKRNAVFI